ncbi:MAG: zinc ribbon domain-containing protein [Actinobacteria bacterium]|nr:zinc ribbon domain-containing protein [Actinomycetota bacterium]
MPLHTKRAGDCRGTERDGSKSEKWCSLCYVNGEFVSPNMSLVEMAKAVDDALRREKVWLPMRYMATRQLPRLERWR